MSGLWRNHRRVHTRIMSAQRESFRKSRLRGWVTSSEGFRVRIEGRTALRYEDSQGVLHLDSETMADPEGVSVVLYLGSIPEDERRPKRQVIDNIARAFEFARWTLRPQD